MFQIRKNKEVNIGRQYHIDMLKAVSIISMILCHTVMKLAAYRPGFKTEAGYLFGDAVLGCYVGVAHAFMFAMGMGFVFSRKNTATDLVKRGLKIYCGGYLFNFFRFGIYDLLRGSGLTSSAFWNSIYTQDIFQFAGLAMMLTAFFRKMQLSEPAVFLISIVLSVIGGAVSIVTTGNAVLDRVLASFVTVTGVESHFTLFNWYIFVAVGMVFGQIIKQIKNHVKFYRRMLLAAGVIMAVYIVLTVTHGMFFLTRNHRYYSVSILEAAGYLSIDFFLLSAFYFILKKYGTDRFEPFLIMSRNITVIYVIHWVILGFLDYLFGTLLKVVLSYPLIYLIGILLIVVSYYIAIFWNKQHLEKKH